MSDFDYDKFGYDNGKQWAEGLADDDESLLARACGFDVPEGDHQWNAPWSALDWFAFHVLGVDPNESLDAAEVSEEFWNNAVRQWPSDDYGGAGQSSIYRAFSSDDTFDEDDFLRGFVSGAQDALADD